MSAGNGDIYAEVGQTFKALFSKLPLLSVTPPPRTISNHFISRVAFCIGFPVPSPLAASASL